MKIRVLLFAAIAGALAIGPVVRAADDKEPETELGKKMEKIGGSFRALRRQITDASKNEDSLAKIATIRQNAEAALKLEPAKKDEIPAADQKKFVADYRAKMKDFIELTTKVEAALKANNNEEAGKLVGAMGDAQKQGHKQFKKDDKKKG
jgi:cytochrome c556